MSNCPLAIVDLSMAVQMNDISIIFKNACEHVVHHLVGGLVLLFVVPVHLFNHLALSLNAHLQGQRNRIQDRREIQLLKREQIQMKEPVFLLPWRKKKGGCVALFQFPTKVVVEQF